MVEAFLDNPDADLEDRLLAAMKTALTLGGEEGPVHSAGMKVVDRVPWPETDLRIDWSDDPIHDLEALWRLWRPLKNDYITRALDPGSAPGYGVPGDPNPAIEPLPIRVNGRSNLELPTQHRVYRRSTARGERTRPVNNFSFEAALRY